MAQKALHRKEALQETCQQIQDYEKQTFETLDDMAAQPMSVSSAKLPRVKLILIGVVLSALAIMPLLYQFVPRHVDYKETTQTISLKPGLNTIGQVALTLSPEGKVLKAQKTEYHFVHKVFGFKSLRLFLGNAAPFFSSLSLCLFFFWYEQQQKNRYVVALKKYVLIIFLLVSLYSVCWALIPELDPVSDKFYHIGMDIAICIALAALCYLCWHYRDRFIQFYGRVRSLISHIFQIRDEHYRPMAIKALETKVDLEETYADIRAFDNLDTYALIEKATELGFSYDEIHKLIAEKVSRDREIVVQMMRLTEEMIEFKRSLENNREKYTEEEIKRIIQSFKDRNPLKGFDPEGEDDKA